VALHMDVDVVLMRDLTELFAMDLGHRPVAAVRDMWRPNSTRRWLRTIRARRAVLQCRGDAVQPPPVASEGLDGAGPALAREP
jgi:lipopolysaccharide biosynthesis glycosyltransferase